MTNSPSSPPSTALLINLSLTKKSPGVSLLGASVAFIVGPGHAAAAAEPEGLLAAEPREVEEDGDLTCQARHVRRRSCSGGEERLFLLAGAEVQGLSNSVWCFAKAL